MNVDDGLEDIRWIRGRGREVARGVLRSSPKPEKRSIFCHRRRIENLCRLFSTQQRPNVYQTPGRRPPPIIGRFVNTVTRGWVGAPNGRAPFRFHGAVVGFVHRWLSRTRNLAASNKHADLGPRSAQVKFFFGVFEKFVTFFSKICAHSERYRNLLAGIFEILTFHGNVAFPFSPVSRALSCTKKRCPKEVPQGTSSRTKHTEAELTVMPKWPTGYIYVVPGTFMHPHVAAGHSIPPNPQQ